MNYTDAVRKQTELSKRLLAGTLSAEERAELAELTAKLDATHQPAGDPSVVKSELTVLDAEAFAKHLAEEQEFLAKAPDLNRLALMRANIAGVQKQAAKGQTTFAVQLPVVEKVDPMLTVLARIEEMEKKFDARFRTGVGHPAPRAAAAPPEPTATPAPAAPPEPATEPVVEAQKNALSKDAIDAVLTLASVDELMAVIGALTAKAADDADESDELTKLLDGTYDLAHLVTCAATIAQKAADLVEAAQGLEKAKVSRMAKPKKPFPGAAPPFKAPEDEAPPSAPEADLGDEEDEEEGAKACAPKKPKAEKGADGDAALGAADPAEDAGVAKFGWGEDLAPASLPVGDRFRELKASGGKRQH